MARAQLADRSLFPTLQASVYLNHAAISPPSIPVIAAASEALEDMAARGVASVGRWLEQREALRVQVAAWLGTHEGAIGFPPGTTRGLIDIALAIPWKPGDVIVCFDGEFPTNVTPWQTVAARFGATILRLPLEGFADGSGQGMQRLEDTLAAHPVRLVAVSAVQFQTGLRMPVHAMAARCHARGADLFVDAIQALGVVPLSVDGPDHDDGIDYLVAGTHKWLMGIDGLAIAYASDRARDGLQPLTAGWLSLDDPLRFLFDGEGLLPYDHPIRRRLDWMEGGVQTTAAFAALGASLDLLLGLGVPTIYEHVQGWHDTIEPQLLSRGFTSARADDVAARSGTLSIRPPGPHSVSDVATAMSERGVAVSTPDGWLRLAPHWPNDVGEVDTVIDAVDALMAGS